MENTGVLVCLPLLLLFAARELANKDMQLTELQDQLEAETCFSVSAVVSTCISPVLLPFYALLAAGQIEFGNARVTCC